MYRSAGGGEDGGRETKRRKKEWVPLCLEHLLSACPRGAPKNRRSKVWEKNKFQNWDGICSVIKAWRKKSRAEAEVLRGIWTLLFSWTSVSLTNPLQLVSLHLQHYASETVYSPPVFASLWQPFLPIRKESTPILFLRLAAASSKCILLIQPSLELFTPFREAHTTLFVFRRGGDIREGWTN